MASIIKGGALVFAALVLGGQPGMSVPASLLGPAAGSPIEFAAALAKASVPAGLEIRASNDVLPAVWPPNFKLDRKPTVPINQLLSAFNEQRQDYRATVTQTGVVVIRPVSGGHPFLDSPSDIRVRTTVKGVMTAASRIFTPLNKRLAGPRAGSGSLSGEDIPIVLDGSGRAVIDTLNQIVARAPGRAWVVTTRTDGNDQRVIEFGFLEGDGSRRRQPMSGDRR